MRLRCREQCLLLQVFCDNYLDGGYHVPHAHKGLAGGLDLGSYSHEIYEKLSLQLCGVAGSSRSGGGSEGGSGAAGAGAADARLSGSDAVYAFIYPNLMVNRYGPWMDVNLVLPLGHDRCRCVAVTLAMCLDAGLLRTRVGDHLHCRLSPVPACCARASV